MIEVSEIRVSLDQGATEEGCLDAARAAVCGLLGVKSRAIAHLELRRRSVDARRKSDVHLMLTARVRLRDAASEQAALSRVGSRDERRVRAVDERLQTWPQASAAPAGLGRPLVVGAGCAGLFAALALAEAGLEPLLVERGDDAGRRTQAVRAFNATGELDPESNIQFGAGGAGTFSDGKLTTGTKGAAHRLILQTFVEAGAPREILWDAKPHIGSDLLPDVVERIVERIEELGGEVRFRTRLVDIELDGGGAVSGAKVVRGGAEEHLAARRIVLACGYSARDVFALLDARGVELARKTFAMGVRIEHLQVDIDRAQYGPAAGHPALGAAPYKLVAHCENGRSLFTFCMCPGGAVVAAASEPGGVVTNGASLHARAGRNANAALLVNVLPADLPGEDPLEGVRLQRALEEAAFERGGGAFQAPVQLLGDFLEGRPSTRTGRVEPTYPRGVVPASFDGVLPLSIAATMRLGIPQLGAKLNGFDDPEAVLTGVETRSSSPVTVVRGPDMQALGTPGLFPCGEGAGYAGGIMSAAADGIRAAEGVIASLKG